MELKNTYKWVSVEESLPKIEKQAVTGLAQDGTPRVRMPDGQNVDIGSLKILHQGRPMYLKVMPLIKKL
jgi:hypothetical protein